MEIINTGNYGEKLYTVTLGTGLAWAQTYGVYAYNESEAVDIVADYCERHKYIGLYSECEELYVQRDDGETVEEYAESHGLTCCGNHGIYMQIINIQED